MLDISKFIDLLTDYNNISDIIDNENLQKYNFSCTCISLKDYNNELMNYLACADNIILTIKEENIQDAVFVYNNFGSDVDDLRNNYNKLINILNDYIDDGELSIFISINITKNSDNIINIYNIEKFKEYFENNNYEDIIDSFNKIFSVYNNIVLINMSFDNYQFTESISFSNGVACQYLFDRSNFIKNRKKVCIASKELNVCPNDFHIFNNNISQYGDIQRHFQKIENILCIKYISNHSQLKKNLLTYRIDGNKILSGIISYDQLINYNMNLYDVYLWIYTDINISEKINICRTIISMTYDDILNIDGNLLNTLESNFRIYMIENVERYINVKTALTNQILDSINKLNEEYKSFYNTFKNNMLVFISAFISLFIIELGGIEANSSEAISSYLQKIYPIIFVFLTASLIWAIIGYFELKDKLCNKNKKLFDKLIKNYKDVLADDQIKSLANSLLSDDISDLQNNSKKYFILWILVIILVFILLSIITFNLNLYTLITDINTFLYSK
jgi:hypothetical protein